MDKIKQDLIESVGVFGDGSSYFMLENKSDFRLTNPIPECVHLQGEILTVYNHDLAFIGRQFLGYINSGSIVLLPEHQLLNLILNVTYLRTLTLKGMRKRIAIHVEDERKENE